MKHQNTIEESVIYHADNKEILQTLPAYSFSLMITDPPYNYVGSTKRKSNSGNDKKTINTSALFDYDGGGELCRIKSEFGESDINAFMSMIPRLMRKMNAYIFCNEYQIGYYYQWALRHGYSFKVLVWEKPLRTINKSSFAQNVEFIVRIYERGTRLNESADQEDYNRVFHFDREKNKKHPTQKSLEICLRLIRMSSQPGDAVLDPFLGSGTTAVAAKMLGRKYVGIEKNDDFFAAAKERIDVTIIQ